jgi:hypothetical protein
MDPIAHFTIPVLLLLFLFRSNKRLVFLLAPLTLFSDMDFFTNIHRILFHNILFVIIVSCVSYIIFSLLFKVKNKKEFFFIACFLLGAHLLLDFDHYGIGLFYPFDYHIYGFDFNRFHFVFKEYKDGFWLTFPFEQIPKKQVLFIIILQLIFWHRAISEFYRERLIKSKAMVYFIKKANNLFKTVNI